MDHNAGCMVCKAQRTEEMFHAFCQAEDLITLMDLMAPIFKNPLHITDTTYKLLACSNYYSDVDDIPWTDTAELGYLSTRILAEAKSRHVVKVPEKQSDRVHFVWRSKISTYPMLVYYIYRGRRLLGYLSMLCITEEPDEDTLHLLGLLSDLIAKFMVMGNERRLSDETPVHEDILINLITMTERNEEVIRNRSTVIGLHAYSAFCLVNISTSGKHRMLRDAIRAAFPYARVFYYMQQVMLLLPRPARSGRTLTAHEYELLMDILEETDSFACVSDEFYSLADLRTAYNHNMAILQMSSAYRQRPVQTKLYTVLDHLSDRIIKYDHFKMVSMAFSLISSHAPEEILNYVNQAVKTLEEYDRENNGQLLPTLLLFVEQKQSYVRVSELMFTHKNTVTYRLKKIQSLIPIDFSDGNLAASIYHSGVLLQTYRLLTDT